GCFCLIFPKRSKIMPTKAPPKHAMKKVSKTFFTPSITPNTPNNFISPPPIPPRLTMMINATNKNPIKAPATPVHQGVKGCTNRTMTNKGKKNNKILYLYLSLFDLCTLKPLGGQE